MHKSISILTFCFGIAAASLASATPEEDTELFVSENLSLALKANETADLKLNKAYKNLRNAIKGSPNQEQSLLKAQRTWLAWRDSEAVLCVEINGYPKFAGGYNQIFLDCKTSLTEERTKKLKEYTSLIEGSME